MKIANTSGIVQTVQIVLGDGRKTSVRVMPKARVDLPEGAKVDNNWLVNHDRVIKILTTQAMVTDLHPETDDE